MHIDLSILGSIKDLMRLLYLNCFVKDYSCSVQGIIFCLILLVNFKLSAQCDAAVIMSAPEAICQMNGIETGLSGGIPQQGTNPGDTGAYSGPGVIDNGNGLTFSFDPSLVNAGKSLIFYTYTDQSGCEEIAVDSIMVLEDVQFKLSSSAFCIDACFQLGLSGGTPLGGEYIGNGVIDDGNGETFSFDPEVAGAGAHAIYYQYEDDFGCTLSELDFLDVVENCEFCPDVEGIDIRFSLRRLQLLGCASPTEGADPQLKMINHTNGNQAYFFGFDLNNNSTHSTISLAPHCMVGTVHDIGIVDGQTSVDLSFQSAEIIEPFCEEFDGNDTNISNIITETIDLSNLTLYGAIGGEINFLEENGCLRYEYVIVATSCDQSTCQAPEILCPEDDFGFSEICNDENVPPAATTYNLGYCPFWDPALPTVFKGCGNLELSSLDVESISNCSKIIERTYTITDENGSTSSCTQSYTIPNDNTAPWFEAVPNDLTVSSQDIPDIYTMVGVDDCMVSEELLITFSESTGNGIYPIDSILYRTWNIADNCGNTSSYIQEISVLTNSTPSISCPDDLTVQLESEVIVDPNEADIINYCPDGYVVTVTNTLIEQTPDNPTTNYHFEYTYISNCNETLSCTQIISIIPPAEGTITCPPDTTVEDINNIIIHPSDAETTNFCNQGYNISVENILIDGLPNEDETIYHYQYTMTDNCGAELSCIRLITIEINNDIPINISCPAETIVNCSSEINPIESDLLIEGFCGEGYTISISDTQINEAACTGSEYTFTYLLESACGDTVTCQRVYTIQNNGPFISCPQDQTVSCLSDIDIDLSLLNVLNNCNYNYLIEIDTQLISGSSGCSGSLYKYEYIIIDECNNFNSCEQFFTIQNTPAEIICPSDTVISCDSDLNFLPINIQVNSNCDYGYSVNFSYQLIEGEAYCGNAVYLFEYTILEECGNQQYCSRLVSIENDDFLMVIPEDITVSCASDIQTSGSDVLIFNNCNADYNVSVTNTFINGTPNCSGTSYFFDYYYVDACSYSTVEEQKITIVQAPVIINLPEPMYIDCIEDIVLDGSDAQIISDCDRDYNISITDPVPLGEPNCAGTIYTIVYIYEDECGVIQSAERIVIINENPSIQLETPQDLTVFCSDDIPALLGGESFSSSCNIDINRSVELFQIQGVPNCPSTTYQYLYSISSACGNIAMDYQTFTIENDPPELIPPLDFTINCNEPNSHNLILDWISQAYAITSCELESEIFSTYDPFAFQSNGPSDNYNVDFYLTDECGRIDSSSSNIIVIDNESPIITTEAYDYTTVCYNSTPSDFESWISANASAMAFDECQQTPVNWYTIPTNPTINCSGESQTVTIEFVAVDDSGNTNSTSADFIILNNQDSNTNLEKLCTNQSSEEDNDILLFQNAPNPFMYETEIWFYTPKDDQLTFSIVDSAGKKLMQSQQQYSQGCHSLIIDQSTLSAGVLIYFIQSSDSVVAKKMVLAKE